MQSFINYFKLFRTFFMVFCYLADFFSFYSMKLIDLVSFIHVSIYAFWPAPVSHAFSCYWLTLLRLINQLIIDTYQFLIFIIGFFTTLLLSLPTVFHVALDYWHQFHFSSRFLSPFICNYRLTTYYAMPRFFLLIFMLRLDIIFQACFVTTFISVMTMPNIFFFSWTLPFNNQSRF